MNWMAESLYLLLKKARNELKAERKVKLGLRYRLKVWRLNEDVF